MSVNKLTLDKYIEMDRDGEVEQILELGIVLVPLLKPSEGPNRADKMSESLI